MADELETKYLYIDTSVFEYRQFDLKGSGFASLLELAHAGHAILLTSTVTVGECKKHIEAHVAHAASERKKFAAEAWMFKRFPEFDVLFQKPDKTALSERLIAEFEDYLSTAKAESIDINDASVTDIVKQYFDEAPPFGTGTKKAEFPDAIVLSALAAWCEQNAESCYVITRDKNMAAACEDAENLYPLLDIPDFLDLANSQEEVVADKLKAILKSREESLKNDIGEKFKDLDIYVEDEDGEVDIDSIEDVEFGNPEIISIEETQATIEVECDVAFVAYVTYKDPETGVWDSEDGRMLFVDTIHKNVRKTTYASVEILFEYESLVELAKHEDPDISVMSVVRHRPITIRV